MFGIGKKDEHGQPVRIEHRGKFLRLSRTGGAALRTQGKAPLGVNVTLNTSQGVRLSKRIAKGARVALQNGKFRLIGRWRSGPLAFNLSKSGVSASIKNEAGTINLFKPQYSSYKVAGIQFRGKKAMHAHIAYMAIKAAFALAVLAIVLVGILLWAVAFLGLFIWDFFAGMFGRSEEEAVRSTRPNPPRRTRRQTARTRRRRRLTRFPRQSRAASKAYSSGRLTACQICGARLPRLLAAPPSRAPRRARPSDTCYAIGVECPVARPHGKWSQPCCAASRRDDSMQKAEAKNDGMAWDSSFRESSSYEEEDSRLCDAPGCALNGVHRAPKGRDYADGTYWFCLQHIKEFNSSWNYFDGMNPAQIEAAVRSSSIWDRATWPVNRHAPAYQKGSKAWVDPFELFSREFREAARRRQPLPPKRTPLCGRALDILDLKPSATPAQIRRRALSLIKRLHPDTNKGRAVDGNRLIRVIWAWRRLRPAIARPED